MAKVQHYIPEMTSKFICAKGGMHAEEPLNLVCLDPLCRNDPLACSVCFVNTHKVCLSVTQHHRVVSVDKFMDDYARNVKDINENRTMKKISKYHCSVKDLIGRLREEVNREFDHF